MPAAVTRSRRDSPDPFSITSFGIAMPRSRSTRRTTSAALAGVAMPKLVIENGSGLSRSERITAGGLVRLLVAADRSAVREDFASSLAVAAIDGTLERRFLTGPVGGQALLKTGSLEGVRALAGYVLDAAGHRHAVAAIINHPNAARGGAALDALVQWIWQNGATWDPAHQR